MRRRADAAGRLRADSATPVLHATATIALHAHASKHPRHTCHHRQHTHSARAHGACSHQPVFLLFRVTSAGPQAAQPDWVPHASFLSAVSADTCACVHTHARRRTRAGRTRPCCASPLSPYHAAAPSSRQRCAGTLSGHALPRPPNRRDGLHLVRHGLPHVGAHAGGALEPVRRLVREEWLPARISGEAAVLHAEGVELGRPLATEHFRHVASHPAVRERLLIVCAKANWKPLPFRAKQPASANSSAPAAAEAARTHRAMERASVAPASR